MAGRRIRNQMIERLEERTRDAYPDEPNASHLDYVVSWQASGKLLATLHTELGVSHDMLERYLKGVFGEENYRQRLSNARKDAAYPLQEQSLQVAMSATSDNVQVARLQSEALRRTAENWRNDFGRIASGVGNESPGALHLAALLGANAAAHVLRNVTRAPVSLEPAVALVAPVTVLNGASDNGEQSA